MYLCSFVPHMHRQNSIIPCLPKSGQMFLQGRDLISRFAHLQHQKNICVRAGPWQSLGVNDRDQWALITSQENKGENTAPAEMWDLDFPAQTKYLDLMAQSREEVNIHHPIRKSFPLLLCCLSLCQWGIELSDGGRWICSAVQRAKNQVITVTLSPESFQKSIYKQLSGVVKIFLFLSFFFFPIFPLLPRNL